MCQMRIRPLVDRTERPGREAVTAQLFGNRLHLVRPNALHMHLSQRPFAEPLRRYLMKRDGYLPPSTANT
jgi:hypothetical protein